MPTITEERNAVEQSLIGTPLSSGETILPRLPGYVSALIKAEEETLDRVKELIVTHERKLDEILRGLRPSPPVPGPVPPRPGPIEPMSRSQADGETVADAPAATVTKIREFTAEDEGRIARLNEEIRGRFQELKMIIARNLDTDSASLSFGFSDQQEGPDAVVTALGGGRESRSPEGERCESRDLKYSYTVYKGGKPVEIGYCACAPAAGGGSAWSCISIEADKIRMK